MIELVRIYDYASIEPLSLLASQCFKNDPFYALLHDNESKRVALIQSIFRRSLKISLDFGFVIAHKENDKFVSLSSWVDYNHLRLLNSEDFNFIFNPQQSNQINNPAVDLTVTEFSVIKRLTNHCPLSMYLVSICVDPQYRRKGLATSLVKSMITRLPQYNFFSDISNPHSIDIYTSLGFEIVYELNGISFVKHSSADTSSVFTDVKKIPLLLPPTAIDSLGFLKDCQIVKSLSLPYFKFDESGLLFKSDFSFGNHAYKAVVINVDYKQLLLYQKSIGVSQNSETLINIDNQKYLIYISSADSNYSSASDSSYNSGIKGLVSIKEEDIIPDVIISIPINYTSLELIHKDTTGYEQYIHKPSAYNMKMMTALDFRTEYESGTPDNSINSSNGFKNRIKRFCIHPVKIQLETEEILNFSNNYVSEPIGSPMVVDLIISIDELSQCGVLHLLIPSCALLISQLLDSMSRNQLMIADHHEKISFFDYINTYYGITKCGAPKGFVTIFENRSNIDSNFLGSLLFGETYYEDNTGLGSVVDSEICNQIKSEFGKAQYNYASVYSYKNVLLQMTSRFRDSIDNRIIQESITLFYIELILFEEAAIVDVENNISIFLNNLDSYSNSEVMSNINTILTNYAKSSDFWDIQMNYPSSRKSVEEIRSSFQISKLRKDVAKKKEMLLNICTIRDTILDETEGYFISIIGIIVAAFSCADIINSSHVKLISVIVLILVILFISLRYRMNRKIRYSRINIKRE